MKEAEDCKEKTVKTVKKKKLSKQRKNKLAEENAFLRKKFELHQVEHYKLESEFDSLEIKYKTTLQEKEEIRKTSEAYQKKNMELKGRLKDSISIYNETDKQWQQSCLKYKRLEREFENHKKDYRRQMGKNREMEYTIRDYRKKDCLLFNLRRKVALQESEIKSSHEMLEEYKSKNLELENKLKECLLTEGDLKMMVRNLKRKLENCECHIDVARETVDNLLKRRGSRIYERDQQIQEPSSSDDSSCDSEDAVTSHDEDNKSMSSGSLHSGSSTPDEEKQSKKWRLNGWKDGPERTVPSCSLERKRAATPPTSPPLDPKPQTSTARREFADQYQTEGNMPPSARPPFRSSYDSLRENYAKRKLSYDEMFKKRKLDNMEVENRNGQRGSRFMTPGSVNNDELTKNEQFKKLVESRAKEISARFAKLKH